MFAHRGFGVLLTALLALLVTSLGTSSPARAWTRSVVGGAQTKVDLGRDGTARVALRLEVDVQAGWLHELELAGLGDDVVLDPSHPPYLRSEDGEVYRPEAEVDAEGRIHLSFSRREAPKRGEYRVFLKYESKVDATAVKVAGQRYARIVWTLPGWETGLQGVSVELRAPKGASVPDSIEMPPGVEVEVSEQLQSTVFRWQRIHLPRMTPWSLTIDVPADSFVLPATPSAPAPRGFEPLPDREHHPVAWTLLAVAALALLKRRAIELTMGRQHLALRSSWPLVLSGTAVIFAAGQCLGPDRAVWAVPWILWALPRPASPRDLAALDGEWHPARITDLPRRKPGIGDFFDATTTLGMFALAVSSTGLCAIGQPAGALMLLPVFLCGTCHHCSPTGAESARLLGEFISELQLPWDAPEVAFGWELASTGRCRIRLDLASRRAGLRDLSFVVGCSSNGFVFRREIMLLVQTRAQSDADDLVRRRLPAQTNLHKSNGVVSRLVDWNTEALELVRALSRETPKPVTASRGTWLLREISKPSKKAA